MALTDPFPADVESWLAEPIEHLSRVTIIPPWGAEFDVVADRLDITYDLDWTPFVQARISIQTPIDATQRSFLDARLSTKVRIKAGYRYRGKDYPVTLATLRLHEASRPTPGILTEISVQGSELVPLEQASRADGPAYFDNYVNKSAVVPFLRSWINRGWEPGVKPQIYNSVPDWPWGSEITADYKHSGGSYWSAIEWAAQLAGLRVFDPGDEIFRIQFMPQISTDLAGSFRTGKGGTMTGANDSNSREPWANQVELDYSWEDEAGNPNATSILRRIASGPYAAGGPATKIYREDLPGPINYAAAQARADWLLNKFMRRGNSRTFTAAAAYWIRPGMTIRSYTGTGSWETSLVGAVTFSPLTGSMSITTTTPADYEIGN